ncbi:MAG: peptidylprolyl isomerase [Dehalococcoidales bacterium]|nr:peptidylprolyl isomerase [Dehalococcoidales bacterium]
MNLIKKWQIGMITVILSGAMVLSGCSSAAKVGDTVKVDYTGTLTDGTVFDSSVGKTPLEFTVGAGQMIKGFDNALPGMKVGQNKTVVLPPEDAYGAYREDLVVAVNKTQMGSAANATVGQKITVVYANGTGASFVVLAVNATSMTLDTNPPLAGKTLKFDIKLVSITPKK